MSNAEEATRTPKQALVLNLGVGLYSQNSNPQTLLSWPYHYVLFQRTPGVPAHFVFTYPNAQGTR
jgi:hypothetical protein